MLAFLSAVPLPFFSNVSEHITKHPERAEPDFSDGSSPCMHLPESLFPVGFHFHRANQKGFLNAILAWHCALKSATKPTSSLVGNNCAGHVFPRMPRRCHRSPGAGVENSRAIDQRCLLPSRSKSAALIISASATGCFVYMR